MTSAYVTSILSLQQACRANGTDFTCMLGSSDALITRARADMVTAFLDHPRGTHLLFVDADIGFEAEQVFRLMSFGKEVVAGVYPAKAFDWDKIRRALAENRRNPQAAGLNYVVGVEDPARVQEQGGFIKVRHVGNGFLMIRRSALERLCAAHPELKYERVHARNDVRQGSPNRYALFETMIDKDTGEYLSEDYAFCRRWRDLGGEIWADLKSRLTHVGSMRFVGDLSAQFDPRA